MPRLTRKAAITRGSTWTATRTLLELRATTEGYPSVARARSPTNLCAMACQRTRFRRTLREIRGFWCPRVLEYVNRRTAEWKSSTIDDLVEEDFCRGARDPV